MYGTANGLNGPLVHDFTHLRAGSNTQDVPASYFQQDGIEHTGAATDSQAPYVLELLAKVYKNDEVARERNLSDHDRLIFHQSHSRALMDELEQWMTEQLDEKHVEPNSSLGEAISYMLRHWEKLTLFLRKPGAPLDNNICERALKKAILHRKNAYFYKTANGAKVGDLFMSLIHTCELNKVNPFEYLTQLQKHAEAVALCPADWMPWNYQKTLTRGQALRNT